MQHSSTDGQLTQNRIVLSIGSGLWLLDTIPTTLDGLIILCTFHLRAAVESSFLFV